MVQGCTLPAEYAPKFKTTINTELLPPARGDISPMTLQTLSPNKQAAPVTQRVLWHSVKEVRSLQLQLGCVSHTQNNHIKRPLILITHTT